MNKHRHKKTRCCAHCGQPFIVNPRIGKRHRFCTKPACAEVSHYVANKRWLRRNGGKAFHRGDEAINRVHNWRETHPRYWKRTRQTKRGRHTYFMITKPDRTSAGDDAIWRHAMTPIGITPFGVIPSKVCNRWPASLAD
jgi:hypothetical protein